MAIYSLQWRILPQIFSFLEPFNVSYDHRALIVASKRRMLISAGVHYPRATPEYNFEGRYDLVKLVGSSGLYHRSLRGTLGKFVKKIVTERSFTRLMPMINIRCFRSVRACIY
ncbi:unnamed protein product [Thlaspi arvense]|uniref:Beta-galactosidase n=1 Tax=Thlaspi arvense TaxID=13288 RepID=A0AAU9SES4_THLAR|nr:unnamed protein product [Thlaspi arvense]